MTRHLIVRLNIRLKSMKSVPVKCLREDSTHPSLYIALAAVRHIALTMQKGPTPWLMVCKRFRRRGCGECGSRRLPSHRGSALALQRVPMGAALSTARRARGFHADPPADRRLFFRLPRSLSGIGSLEARINNLRAIPGL